MLFRKVLCVTAACLVQYSVFAQEDFCDAINTIIRDAPSRFHNTRGKMLQSSPGAGMWECMIKVPGTISSRFVSSMGAFYEGALYQATTKDGMKQAYDKWKTELSNCLAPQGYKIWFQDNFYPGMAEFKKVVFMKELGSDTKVGSEPAHMTMEAQYSKATGRYAIVMFIYEH
jgi:hypothetical protein